MTRSRSRSRTVNGTRTTHTYAADYTLLSTVSFDRSYTYTSSSITDDIGPTRKSKPCSHTRTEWDFVSIPRDAEAYNDHISNSGSFSDEVLTLEQAALGRVYNPSVDYSIDWDQGLRNLYDNATGRMPEGASLLVNIIEISDLKNLVGSLWTPIQSLVRSLGKKSFKDLSNIYLAKEFGLDNVLRDFKAFVNTWSRVNEKLSFLELNNNKSLRLGARCPVSFEETFPSLPAIIDDGYGGSTYDNTGLYAKFVDTKIVANVSCNALIRLRTERAILNGLISALGLDRPLHVLWEVIPFSFVIDWFLPVADLVDKFDTNLTDVGRMAPLSELTDFTHSLKIDRYVTYDFYQNCSGPYASSSVSGPYPAGGCRYTTYDRWTGFPPVGGFTAPNGWNLRRTALSAALIVQRT
jgi:hypothetical protein